MNCTTLFFFTVDMLTSSVAGLSTDVVPDFKEPIQNVTVAVGREAILSCSVTDLGQYRVSADLYSVN